MFALYLTLFLWNEKKLNISYILLLKIFKSWESLDAGKEVGIKVWISSLRN